MQISSFRFPAFNHGFFSTNKLRHSNEARKRFPTFSSAFVSGFQSSDWLTEFLVLSSVTRSALYRVSTTSFACYCRDLEFWLAIQVPCVSQ